MADPSPDSGNSAGMAPGASAVSGPGTSSSSWNDLSGLTVVPAPDACLSLLSPPAGATEDRVIL